MLRTILLLFTVLAAPAVAISQNLVPNPSFEENEGGIKKWHLKDHYDNKIKASSWSDGPGWKHKVCSCRNKITDAMVLDGVCNLDLVGLADSCQIVQMTVHDAPPYYHYNNAQHKISLTSFISTELKEAMQVGKFYEISLSVHFPTREVFADEVLEQFGLKLLNKKISTYNIGIYKSGNYLGSDDIKMDTWQTLNWKIRPLCTMSHLTIGVYVDKTWTFENGSGGTYPYFIDNISIKEVKPEIKEDFQYYECIDFESDKEVFYSGIDSTFIYFENNRIDISEEAIASLQSLADTLNKYPYLVLNIEAGADSKGSDNEQLSKNRLQAVTAHLTNILNIPEERIIGRSISDSLAIASIGDGRSNWKYRSALLTISNLLAPQKIYRDLIRSCKTSNKNAFGRYFRIWSNIVNSEDIIHILFDPRLDECLPQWANEEVMELLKAQHNSEIDFGEVFFLDSLYINDQMTRSHRYKLKLLTGRHEWEDNLEFSIPEEYGSNNDSSNLVTLLAYLKDHSIPDFSKYGKNASRLAPLIINHSLDTSLYAAFLPQFKALCLQGEMEWTQYINLYDRYLKLSGKPQEYGTQWVAKDENSVVLYDHIGADQLNANREIIGLNPINVDRVIYFKQ